MLIRINGQQHNLLGPVNIQSLLEDLGYRSQFVAVAVNSHCIPRLKFVDFTIHANDEIEILAPMAGG